MSKETVARTHRIGTFQGAPFFVEVEIEPAKTPGDVDRLSIRGQHSNSGGQNDDTLADMIAGKGAVRWAPGWHADKAAQLLGIWREWHLNDMHAGCRHQRRGGRYRQRFCGSCGHSWRADVVLSESTANLSGEATPQCPTCNGRNVTSGPVVEVAPFDIEAEIAIDSFSVEWDVKRQLERDADGNTRHPAAGWLRLLDVAGVKPFTYTTIRDARTLEKLSQVFEFIGEHDRAAREAYDKRARDARDRTFAKPIRPLLFKRTETKRAGWVYPKEDARGVLMKPCEVCGYAYGSAWLKEPIPADVRAWLEALDGGDTRSPYDIAAAEFLERFRLQLTTEHAQQKLSKWGGSERQHWRVTLTNGSRRRISFDFWNSEAATAAGESLSAYAVLSCLSSDIHYDSADAIAELGDMPRAQAAAAIRFARRLQKFFTDEERAALAHIW